MDLRRLRALLRKRGTKRTDLVRSVKEVLPGRINAAEKELFDLFIESIVEKLSFKNGRLVTGSNNMGRVASVGAMADFYKGKGLNLMTWVLDKVLGVQAAGTTYFKTFKSKGFSDVADRVNKTMFKRIGYDPKKEIFTSGGYFDSLINDRSIDRQIRQILTGAVASNMSFKELRNRTKDLILTGETNGALKRHYITTGVYDIAAEHDRVLSKAYADDLGMNHFVYAGSILESTRDFCRERVGKVYAVSEALQWESMTWQGKNPSCPIMQCLGGYNCTHTPDYITLELAQLLRPDVPEK